MYIIYFLMYSIISYTTEFGFKYTNSFELLWGSVIVALITWIIDTIIFKFAYDWTGFLSKLCDYDVYERKNAHWKFRILFSIPVLIFSLTPLCSMIMTPLVHTSYLWISDQYTKMLAQVVESIKPK